MTPSINDRIVFSFAESVRQQANRIIVLVEVGKLQEASMAALSLTEQAARVKKELSVDQEPSNPT